MKRSIALLLVLSIVLLTFLAACGSNDAGLDAEKSPLSGQYDTAGDDLAGTELEQIPEDELTDEAAENIDAYEAELEE